MELLAGAASYLGIAVFVVVLFIGAFITLLGLPGTLVILIDAVIYSACTRWEKLPWWLLLVLAGITLVSEVSDNLISAAGVKKYGGSTAGMIWAMIGGLIGAVVIGAVLGGVLPIVAPILGGLIGGFAGGYGYERGQGKSEDEARKAGMGAVLGRLAGSLLKSILAVTMVVIVLTQAF